MDTKPLERFATRTRRELLAAIEAQAAAVLAAGSIARSEHNETVNRLEAEIAEHGKKHVIDKVAYTWFNRLIALRYMDARGYTSAGVVSPGRSHARSQPEILADAKRGLLDEKVVTSTRTRDAVMGLLEGTRRSTDSEGEAYALLLTEYCRFWNKAMPFMFEREGDHNELLIPSGLLADGGILSHANEVLSEDVCADVEVIGWLYQFYISERKDEVFAGFKKNRKAGADEIPAATQLFTPDWIVRYLVENSLGRLWMLNRPASRLVDQMEYYIAPIDEETDFLKISGPEELTVIDPACGSGHMLTYAFDLLYAIYEEEGYAPSEIPSLVLTYNLHGTEIDPRAGALAAFALTMKARHIDRRFFRKEVEPKVCVIERIWFRPDELDFLVKDSEEEFAAEEFWNQFRHADTLGSLIRPDEEPTISASVLLDQLEGDLLNGNALELAHQAVWQAEMLGRQYAVVIANPPYMGSKNMTAGMTEFAKDNFTNSKFDLFAMFIQRCISFTSPGGSTALITMQSWMFLSSYHELRNSLISNVVLNSAIHLGSGAFDTIGGEVVSTVAFSLQNVQSNSMSMFIRLVDYRGGENKKAALRAAINDESATTFVIDAKRFRGLENSPMAYWLTDEELRAFSVHPRLDSICPVGKGLDTGDNEKFLRLWHEVDLSTDRWLPCEKGGPFRRWFGNTDWVINWEDEGRELKASPRSNVRNLPNYFKPGITWSRIGGSSPGFRAYDEGHVLESTGPAAVPDGGRMAILGLLNSTIVRRYLSSIAPTLDFQSGHISSVPVPDFIQNNADIGAAATLAVEASRGQWNRSETAPEFKGLKFSDLSGRVEDFSRSRILENAQIEEQINECERLIDSQVATAYGLENAVVESKTSQPFEMANRETIVDLISYSVGCMFGRYSLDEPGLILADQGSTLKSYFSKVPAPRFDADQDNVIPFVDDDRFGDDVVERFREFLRVVFGSEHFEENLWFVVKSLGVKNIRDYFIAGSNPSSKGPVRSRFYEDHVRRYKKRPIYWMFSSPKGSFNALIYLHRYSPATVSTVLNEYLREYRAKLEVALQRAEEAAAGGVSAKEHKEADRLRAVLAELRDYEHDVLYPLDIQRVEIDLDDGVKANYPKFSPALRPIKGLEASE